MVFSQSIVVVSWAFLLEGILMWVRTALFTSLTSYRSWLIELVRVTARRLGSSMTLLGGAPVNLREKWKTVLIGIGRGVRGMLSRGWSH